MTRRDFELIAKAINETELPAECEPHYVRCAIAMTMARALWETNARFDKHKFVAACMKGH